MGISMYARAGFRALAPGLRLPVGWESRYVSCGQREWGVGPLGYDAIKRRKPGAPGKRAGELHLDCQSHRGAVSDSRAFAWGYSSAWGGGLQLAVSTSSRASRSSSSAK